MKKLLPFNDWSKERIARGKKICTSRNRRYKNDPRVYLIIRLPLGAVKDYLYKEEGAKSPQEFEKVWCSIYRTFNHSKMVYVHFGDFTK